MATPHTTDHEKYSPLVARLRSGVKFEGVFSVPLKEFDVDAVFVLSPQSALEVQRLASKKGTTAEAEDLHLPYNSIVVEMPLTDEIRKLRADTIDDKNARNIVRVAAVIRRAELEGRTAVTFWPFWEFDNGSIGSGIASFTFFAGGDDAPHNVLIEDPTGKLRKAFFTPSPAAFYAVSGHSEEQKFLRMQALFTNAPHLINECVTEVAPLLFAWEAVMNCKSGITRTAFNPSANRGKLVVGKRKKIMANTEYTIISLSAVETVSLTGVTSQRSDVEAHLVRGHFKRRRNGVYWWSPFIRGTGELRHRKAYIIEGESI